MAVEDGKGEPFEITLKVGSINEGLNVASSRLAVPVSDIKYVVLQRGRSGFLGIGRRPYKIKFYKVSEEREDALISSALKIGEEMHGYFSIDYEDGWKVRAHRVSECAGAARFRTPGPVIANIDEDPGLEILTSPFYRWGNTIPGRIVALEYNPQSYDDGSYLKEEWTSLLPLSSWC